MPETPEFNPDETTTQILIKRLTRRPFLASIDEPQYLGWLASLKRRLARRKARAVSVVQREE